MKNMFGFHQKIDRLIILVTVWRKTRVSGKWERSGKTLDCSIDIPKQWV